MYPRLVFALFIGVIVGFERAKQNKIAGIRTHALVCLGACLCMIVSLLNEGPYRDPLRFAAQVISGISFIGVGVIWSDKRNYRHGVTTAANLWISACLGLVIGYGLYDVAIFTVILMWLAFQVATLASKLGFIQRNIQKDSKISDTEKKTSIKEVNF